MQLLKGTGGHEQDAEKVRQRLWTVAREARDVRERRDPKFEVLGSKFRKPRTSDLEPSSVSHVTPFPQVSRVTRHGAWRWRTFSAFC